MSDGWLGRHIGKRSRTLNACLTPTVPSAVTYPTINTRHMGKGNDTCGSLNQLHPKLLSSWTKKKKEKKKSRCEDAGVFVPGAQHVNSIESFIFNVHIKVIKLVRIRVSGLSTLAVTTNFNVSI